MFKNLFNRQAAQATTNPYQFKYEEPKEQLPVVEEPPQPVLPTVQEIHETFYTEVDRLLEEASIEKSLESTQQALVEKCERLRALGFYQTKEINEAQDEVKRINAIRAENERNKILFEAINYFTVRYPNYKFITEESIKKICEKYGLVHGEISRYTGTVPDKNLKHIEDFQLAIEDQCSKAEYFFYSKAGMGVVNLGSNYFPTSEHDKYVSENKQSDNEVHYSIFPCPLEIAAPLSDFNTSGMRVEGHKLVMNIPDPVVFKPVIFKNQKYYLIVTAWGDEASDPIVVNQIHN